MKNNTEHDTMSGSTVYIIDDDEAVCDSLGILLSSIGLKNKGYLSANEFLEAYTEPEFEKDIGCIVLDVRMPGINGMDCQSKLNDLNNTLPIIIITGHADIPMAIEAMKNGAFDFMEKPFREQALLTSVQNAINKSKLEHLHLEHILQTQDCLASLTERETQILHCIVDGKANKVIASELNISERTVEVHRAHLMEKMKATSLAHLIRLYLDVIQNSE